MIRIRFFGPGELIQNGFRAAQCTGLMMSLRLRERHDNSVDNVMRIVFPKWRKCKNISARISRTGAGANIVCGRGVNTQHRQRTPDEDSVEVATVAVDNCLRNTPGEDSILVLVLRDRETRFLSVHAAPMKGALIKWTAQQVVCDLQRLGHHGRLMIRCDQEATLKSLVSEVTRMREDAVTISEHSAVGDSQGNGFIGRAVRTVKEMVRTLKLELGARVSDSFKITHKVILRWIGHAFDLVDRVQVGQDGKRASNVLKGKRFNGDIVRFANPVMMRVAGKFKVESISEGCFDGMYMEMRFQ